MRRKTKVLSIGGALVACAVIGTALGASAAENGRQGLGTAPPATTLVDDPDGAPAESPDDPTTDSTTTEPTGDPSIDPTGRPTIAPTGSPGAAPAGSVSLERAVQIALATAGGGRLHELEREWEHGRSVWKVEVVKDGWEIEIYVDAATGGIVKTDRDKEDDGDRRGRHGGDDRRGDDD